MSTPAEQYAAFRHRQREAGPALTTFRELYEFELDDFQLQACRALERGKGVLVAAPTGAGKTVVGEFAVHLAMQAGRKCFYTTPIKALSNQKYQDLTDRYGADQVGLLTGDNSINGDAPVVVMTTEVLRNMLYAGSATLDTLGYVVLDEVHYLADRFRGAVWEEVIIHLPESVSVVALSATVSNAEEFGEWLTTVRGDTAVVVEEHRPVPLWQQVMAGDRLYDLFVDDQHQKINPELLRRAREDDRLTRISREHRRDANTRSNRGRPGRGGSRPRYTAIPRRWEVIARLQRERLLPAITFIFSRAGCSAAVDQCVAAGLRLTTAAERTQIREIVERRTAELGADDLLALGYADWLDGLERGFAAHHAGLLPTFKETVEELFQRGLVRAVFATETLALGINMPARTVVLEKLVKWNGETHAEVSAGEYTQLTGRAGRRGIDVEGNAVVVWHQGFDPAGLAGLASTRTYPLRSSFRPSYNMAVNLVGSFGWHTARELLETSFAQFQADRAVVGMARQVRSREESLAGYQDAMTCHLGDFEEYARLRRRLSDRERELSREGNARRRDAVVRSLEALRPGDIIVIPGGRRSGPAVVIDASSSEREEPRTVVLTLDKQVKRLSTSDFTTPVDALRRLRVPRSFSARSANSRRDLAAALREASADLDWRRPGRRRGTEPEDERIRELRTALRAHPCHGCDEREQHARWAERYWRLHREVTALQRRVEGRTSSIARQYDQVCTILAELGYLSSAGDDARVTGPGRMLQRLYTELDLLAGECLRRGVWEGLTPAELASCASLLVFESRGEVDPGAAKTPGGATREAIAATLHAYDDLAGLEREHRVKFLREPDAGFAWVAYRWASGHRLESVLADSDLAAGDFVRRVRQLVDLLGQIADAAGAQRTPAGTALASAARQAVRAVQRGVVSFSSL
ncbi:MAG TPA: DEAD/DEAH box helicase [Candidatus Nanopelagicales bacterium]|nr:DEAD/DEAH box helicase [Candidatus Nanopelagicales bacterium]